MALLIVVDAAAAIQGQTIKRLFLLTISEGERVLWAIFIFWCCLEIWFGMNRTGHPDWVKMFSDSNGQIKLRAKQNIQGSFCYNSESTDQLKLPVTKVRATGKRWHTLLQVLNIPQGILYFPSIFPHHLFLKKKPFLNSYHCFKQKFKKKTNRCKSICNKENLDKVHSLI